MDNKASTPVDIWEKEAHRYLYNHFTKTLSFQDRRPTDYKHNKRVVLPKPLGTDGEFQCELRQRGYKEVFDEFSNLRNKKGVDESTKEHSREL